MDGGMNHKVTYLTCCTDLDREKINHPSFGRQFASYETGFRKNLETFLPIIGYSSLPPSFFIPLHRNDSNLRHYFWDKKTILNSIPEKNLYREKYLNPKVYKDGIISFLDGYAPLVLMKYNLIMEAIRENPFNSEYFVWIDCQFTAGICYDFNINENCIAFSNALANRLSKKKFLSFFHSASNLGHAWKFDPSNFCDARNAEPFAFHKCIYGCFWGGHKDIFSEFFNPYWSLYKKFLDFNVIPTEELIFNIMYVIYKDKFDYNFVDNASTYKQTIFDNVFKTGSK
jgi:hypothetical protein